MTTGENLSVDWSNIVDVCTAWMAHPRYDEGSFYREVIRHGGYEVPLGSVADCVATIPVDRRDDFCERVRYWYGGCINLEESRAIHPSKFDRPQGL